MENAQAGHLDTQVRTMVGGHHLLTSESWALSLIRKLKKDHTYLILEGVDNQQKRVCMSAHLIIKPGNARKAEIELEGITLTQLKKIGEGCHSCTWTVSKTQAQHLITTIKEEKAKAARDEINYVLAGETVVNMFVSNSLWDGSKDSLENHSQNRCADGLTRKGHNCCSWAIAMIKSLHLATPTSFNPFFACVPKDLVKGARNGDELVENPNSTRRCNLL